MKGPVIGFNLFLLVHAEQYGTHTTEGFSYVLMLPPRFVEHNKTRIDSYSYCVESVSL